MAQQAGRAGRRPTLVDVAARAGVSRALVSIVMRGTAGASAPTRDRVLQAAAEIGYRPDVRASLLASGRSRLLGVVFEMAGLFHRELLDGLYLAAEDAGYQVILSALTPSRDTDRAAQTLLDFRCEAAILLALDQPIPVLADRIPVVAVGWHLPMAAVDVVRTSDLAGMRQAVAHLIGRGHRRIAHVDGGDGPVPASRRRAYHAVMRRHDLPTQAIRGGINQENGFTAARALFAHGELPGAIIAYNDDVAAGLVEALTGVGVAVPGRVAVVGWDDSSLARLPHLDLTTIRQDAREMTRLAVQRSVARIQQDPVAHREQVLTPTLIVRRSSARR